MFFKEAAALGISSEPNSPEEGLPEPSASDVVPSEMDAAEFVSPELVSGESFSTDPVVDSPAARNWNEASHGVDLVQAAPPHLQPRREAKAAQLRPAGLPASRIPHQLQSLRLSTKPSKS